MEGMQKDKLRPEKSRWMCFRTGVQLPSAPPEEEASNSSSSRMSSRLCIDLGMPFRASPFRFSDAVFCVLRRFKPEEVLVTLRAFLCRKTTLRAFWRGCGGHNLHLASLDALYGLGTWERWWTQDIVVPFCSKKVGTDISHNFSVLQPDSKNLVPFLKTKLEQTKPAYSRGISSIVPFVPLFYKPLFTREEKEKSVYIKKFVEKNWNNWNNGVSGREIAGNQRSILPEKTGTKVEQMEQNWNICLRASLFSRVPRFFCILFPRIYGGKQRWISPWPA